MTMKNTICIWKKTGGRETKSWGSKTAEENFKEACMRCCQELPVYKELLLPTRKLTCRMHMMHGFTLLFTFILKGIVVKRGIFTAAFQTISQGRPHVQSHDGVVHVVLVFVHSVLGSLGDGLGDGVSVKPGHFMLILLFLSLTILSVVFIRRYWQKEPKEKPNWIVSSNKGSKWGLTRAEQRGTNLIHKNNLSNRTHSD